jgi:DNA-binding transcriptional LysR family regulator
VEIDAGVARLPAPTVGREVAAGTLRAIPLDTDPPLVRPLGIIRVRGKPLPPTADRFLEFLRAHGAEEPAAAVPVPRGRRERAAVAVAP